MSNSVWFYLKGNEPQGPLSKDQLINLVNSKEISEDTLIWLDGNREQQKPFKDVFISDNEEADTLEARIDSIEKRNKKVETDKAWEISTTRKISIMALTYIVIIIYSYCVRNYDNILLSSLIPVIGYMLSTLSFGLIKKIWECKRK